MNPKSPASNAWVNGGPALVKNANRRQFFTSDLHLGHHTVSKIRGFDPKDKWTVRDHDDMICERWIDAGIKPTDIVWVLGDLTGSTSTLQVDDALEIMRGLPGRKRLIAGNHDPVHPREKDAHRWMGAYLSVFENVAPFGETRIKGKTDVVMSHFPYERDRKADKIRYRQWRLRDEGDILLCGHTHGTEKVAVDAEGNLREIHVGVDAWDYEPVSEDVIAYLIEDWTRAGEEIVYPGEMARGIVDLPEFKYTGGGGRYGRYDPVSKTYVWSDDGWDDDYYTAPKEPLGKTTPLLPPYGTPHGGPPALEAPAPAPRTALGPLANPFAKPLAVADPDAMPDNEVDASDGTLDDGAWDNVLIEAEDAINDSEWDDLPEDVKAARERMDTMTDEDWVLLSDEEVTSLIERAWPGEKAIAAMKDAEAAAERAADITHADKTGWPEP